VAAAAMTAPKPGDERAEQHLADVNDARKPDSPLGLTGDSWKYVLRRTYREFRDDNCPDAAAGLTYYAVLSLFPAAMALISLLGVFGQGQKSVDKVIQVLGPLVSSDTLKTVQPALEHLAHSQGAGFGLVIGLVGALWSASGYVGAFGRAMNTVYEIDEGRPFWKLRPMMILITLAVIVLVACVLVMLIVSGPLADSVGDVIGLGSQAVTVWKIAKWPLLICFVILIVALLYYTTPNVKQARIRWLSTGACVAIIVWVLASIGFAFYVATFGSYDKVYGSLAGAIAGLLWLWITNLALLFGAELDSELERGRQLQAGIAAEEELQLPARDTQGIRKARETEAQDLERARAIRDEAVEEQSAAGAGRGADGASSHQDSSGRKKGTQ